MGIVEWGTLAAGFVLGTLHAFFWVWWNILRPRVTFRESMRSDEIAHAIDRARHSRVKEGSSDYALLGQLAKMYETKVKSR